MFPWRTWSALMGDRPNIVTLSDDEQAAVLWAIDLALRKDDGFPWPRDQNRVILREAETQVRGGLERADG